MSLRVLTALLLCAPRGKGKKIPGGTFPLPLRCTSPVSPRLVPLYSQPWFFCLRRSGSSPFPTCLLIPVLVLPSPHSRVSSDSNNPCALPPPPRYRPWGTPLHSDQSRSLSMYRCWTILASFQWNLVHFWVRILRISKLRLSYLLEGDSRKCLNSSKLHCPHLSHGTSKA